MKFTGGRKLFTGGKDAGNSGTLSFTMVETHRSAVTLAVVLVVIFSTVITCLVFVPWQQTVHGVGVVTIFSPMKPLYI